MYHRGLSTCGGAEITGMNRNYSAANIIKCIAEANHVHAKSFKNCMKGYDPKDVPLGFGRSFYVMSVAWDKTSTDRLSGGQVRRRLRYFKDYVERHGLGTVQIGDIVENGVHSNNTIMQAALWSPNKPALWFHIRDRKLWAKPKEEYWGLLR